MAPKCCGQEMTLVSARNEGDKMITTWKCNVCGRTKDTSTDITPKRR